MDKHKQLKNEMVRILDIMRKNPAYPTNLHHITPDSASFECQDFTLTALKRLVEIKAICPFDAYNATPRVTLAAKYDDRYEELTAPWRYWLKRNWFRVSMLAVSAIATIAAVIAVY